MTSYTRRTKSNSSTLLDIDYKPSSIYCWSGLEHARYVICFRLNNICRNPLMQIRSNCCIARKIMYATAE